MMMIVEMGLMKFLAKIKPVTPNSFPVLAVIASINNGNAMVKSIVKMVQMKQVSTFQYLHQVLRSQADLNTN